MLKNVLRMCAVAGILSIGISKDTKLLNSPTNWTPGVLQDKVSVSSLKDLEPGFDLSEEEQKKFKIWKNGVIPYYIDVISYDKVLRDRIRSFLDVTAGLTGLQFLEMPSPPRESDTRWVFFINRRGVLECGDYDPKEFTNEGVQKVVLGYDCMTDRDLAQMVLALAGVAPVHNCPHRDNYIEVNMNHIIPEKKHLYEKLGDRDWLFHDLEYDFASAGHFHFHKHTVDGSATISPQKPTPILVGEGEGYSYTDILKVRMLYNYIIRKPYIHSKSSDCKKLFKPGSKLGAYNSRKDEENEMKPRRKPNLYLGLPAEEIQNEGEDAENNDGKDDDKNVEGTGDGDGDQEENNDENNEKNGKEKPESPIGALKNDILNDLSDYETDDGKKRKIEAKFRKPRKAKLSK